MFIFTCLPKQTWSSPLPLCKVERPLHCSNLDSTVVSSPDSEVNSVAQGGSPLPCWAGSRQAAEPFHHKQHRLCRQKMSPKGGSHPFKGDRYHCQTPCVAKVLCSLFLTVSLTSEFKRCLYKLCYSGSKSQPPLQALHRSRLLAWTL